jgi:hypothetical protein
VNYQAANKAKHTILGYTMVQQAQQYSFSGNNYIVDLTKLTRTCGRFQVNDIPCGHAIACLRILNQAPRDHIPEFFSLEHYYHTYEKNVLPINVTALEAQATDNCLPPILKRGRGRPRTRRISKGERQLRRERRERQGLLPDTKDRSANRCRLCGSVGHNSLICVEPVQVPFVS